MVSLFTFSDPYDMDSDSERRLSHEEDLEDSMSDQPPSRPLFDDNDSDNDIGNDNVIDTDNTYGSPGLRQVFNTVNNAQNDVIDEDDDTKEESSMALNEQNSPLSSGSARSRNKRKNFKPRNIHYQASELQPKKLHLMPQKMDSNGPMDLSLQGKNKIF